MKPTQDTSSFRDTERDVYATEQGVVGRFQQQVDHILNDVAGHCDKPYCFGDWYNNLNPTVIPEIAIWQTNFLISYKHSLLLLPMKPPQYMFLIEAKRR